MLSFTERGKNLTKMINDSQWFVRPKKSFVTIILDMDYNTDQCTYSFAVNIQRMATLWSNAKDVCPPWILKSKLATMPQNSLVYDSSQFANCVDYYLHSVYIWDGVGCPLRPHYFLFIIVFLVPKPFIKRMAYTPWRLYSGIMYVDKI